MPDGPFGDAHFPDVDSHEARLRGVPLRRTAARPEAGWPAAAVPRHPQRGPASGLRPIRWVCTPPGRSSG